MAKSKKSNRMKMRGYPTHRFLRYKLQHTGNGDDNHYIDLARDISAMNKRKYEQGRLWGVSSFTLHDNQSRVGVKIAGLRHVWPTYSAYRMARRIWKRQVGKPGIPQGAWQQFIVGLSRDVVTDQDCPLPLDTEDFACKRGEWMISQLSVDGVGAYEANAAIVMTGETNTTNATQSTSTSNQNIGAQDVQSGTMYVRNTNDGTGVTMAAPDFSGTISAMHEWSKMASDTNQTPGLDSDLSSSIFAHLLMSDSSTAADSLSDDVLARQEEEGDHPPYAQDLAGLDDSGTNDGLWIYREARFASGQKTIMMPGAEVPLGLLKVVTNSGQNDTCYLDIEVAPGGYKGVHALEV